MTEYELDALLSAPLPEIADNGFSARLLERIEKERMRDRLIVALAATITALGISLLLPWQQMVAASVLDLGTLAAAFEMPSVYLSIAALSLFLTWERQTAETDA